MLSRILVGRGIESFETAKAYFRPDISQLHDPWLMKDMDLAVKQNPAFDRTERKNSCVW